MSRFHRAAVALASVVTLAACSGGGNAGGSLTITPQSVSVRVGQGPITFSATGSPGSISWQLNPQIGALSTQVGPTTRYTPPPGGASFPPVTLTAMLVGTTASAKATIEIVGTGYPDAGDGGLSDGGDGGWGPGVFGPRLWIPGLTGDLVGIPMLDLASDGGSLNAAGNAVIVPVTGGGFSWLDGVAFDHLGVVWAAGYEQQSTDLLWGYLFAPDAGVAGVTQIQNPPSPALMAQSLAFAPNGDLWVADMAGPSLVHYTLSQLQSSGAPDPVNIIQPVRTDAGFLSLASPSDMAFDSAGNLWVANWATGARHTGGTVMMFARQSDGSLNPDPAVQLYDDGGTLVGPNGLAFDARGNLWIANEGSGSVVSVPVAGLSGPTVLDPNTVLAGSWFLSAANLAFDSSGALWVLTQDPTRNNALLRFNAPAQFHGRQNPWPNAVFTDAPAVGTGRMQFYPVPAGLPLY